MTIDFTLLNNAVLDTFREISGTVTVDGVPVEAIYDSRHFADETGEVGASELLTSITVRSGDLPTLTNDTVIVARGVSYRVWEPRPDGQGMTVLALERVA